MAVNLATAYVEIIPSLRGFHRPIQAALGEVERESGRSGQRSGSQFSSTFGGVMGKIGKAVSFGGLVGLAGTAGLSAGAMFTKGFNRLNNIDQAKAKMMALKMSAEEVDSAMRSAEKAVKGTSFGLDEAAGAAAMASAAGVELGADMDRYLTIVADAAAVGGSSLSEMGAIFGKVAGKGKLDGEVMAQLMDRQIGILPALAEKYGVTTEAAAEMVSDGKVSFQDFQEVMEGMVGGGAKKMGETFSGSLANMQAALGRLGAKLLAPVFNAAPPVFDAIGRAIDAVGKKVGPFTESIGKVFTGLFTGGEDGGGSGGPAFLQPITDAFASIKDAIGDIDFAAIFDRLKAAGAEILPVLQTIGEYLQGALSVAFDVIKGAIESVIKHGTNMWNALKGPLESIGSTVKDKVLPVFQGIGEWAKDQLPKFKGMFESVKKVFDALSPVLAKIAGLVFGALATAFKVIWTVLKPVIAILKPVIGFLLSVIGTVLKVVAAVIAGLAPFVSWLIDNLATPVKAVFSGIGAIMSWLWQNVMLPAWNGIQAAIGAVWNWISGTLWPGIQTVWNAIATVAMWLWQSVIVPAWQGIQAAISVAGDIIRSVVDGIKGFFQGLADKATQVKDWIVDKFNALVNFISQLPGRFTQGLSNIWDGLKEGFRRAINWIIERWNNFELKISLPSVLGGGEIGIGTPDIPLFAGGGKVRGAGTGTSDSILAALSNGEFVVNAKATREWLPLLTWINGGAGNGKRGPIPGFADGGLVGADELLRFARGEEVRGKKHARSLEGAPYVWGGGSRTDWGDCSGAMSMLAAFALGLDPFRRHFATGSVAGWLRSHGGHVGRPSNLSEVFALGWFNGGPYGGHISGTIGGQTNVEMGGGRGDGQIGGQAAPWNHNQYTDHGWVPLQPAGPVSASTDMQAVSGSWGDASTSDGSLPMGTTSAATSPGTAQDTDKSSWSSIFGSAASEYLKDTLDVFGIPDSPSFLQAYDALEDHRKTDPAGPTTGDGKGSGKLDPEDEARRKAEFEDAQVAAKRAYEDKLAKLDADYRNRIDATEDKGEKQRLRDELAAEKQRLRREHEDHTREAKRKYEEDKRKREAEAKSGAETGSTSVPGLGSEYTGTGTADPAAAPKVEDPNTPPSVQWSTGMGAEPWRPLLEWSIKRVGQGLSPAKPQLDAGVKQIQSESSGDPNAVQQIVDVNGSGESAGVGLLQIIPSTFAVYRDKTLPDDRKNPAANIVAALRYYVDRYGTDLTAKWGHGHGYRLGGYTGDVGVDEVAGVVHGREFVVRAAATKRWRPLLEAINRGAHPGELGASGGRRDGVTYAPVTNVTLRNEREFYERQRRQQSRAIAALA